MQAQFVAGDPLTIPYTPVGAVEAGQVVVLGEITGVAHLPIAAGELGSLAVGKGIYKVSCLDAGGIPAGTRVYWDDASNGVTQDLTGGGGPFGFTVEALTLAAGGLVVHEPAVPLA